MVCGNLVQYLRFSKLQQAAYLSREWHPEQCLLKPFCDSLPHRVPQELFKNTSDFRKKPFYQPLLK